MSSDPRSLAALIQHSTDPDPAFRFDGVSVSRAEFEQRVDAATSWLAAQGIGKGDVIAVWLVNRLEWMALLFAAARLGSVVAAGKKGEHRAHSEGAAKWQHREQRVLSGRNGQRPGDGGRMAGERRLRMRDELGLLRRAGRRVEKYRRINVGLLSRDPGKALLECVEPDAWPWCGHITRTYDRQLLQVGHCRPVDTRQDRREIDGAELRLEDEEFGARYPQDVRHIGAAS